MRTLLFLPLAAVLLAATGCGTTKPKRVKNRSEIATEKAQAAEPGAQGDIDCARGIRKNIKKFCNDAPAELGEGYAARARSEWSDARKSCDGMRAKFALRAFDACITDLEAIDNQIDDETKTRRETVAPKIVEARADPVFDKLIRKKRAAQEDADGAAEAFREAVQGQDADGIRFRREEWTEAERVLVETEVELRTYLDKLEIDPRDVRALGVW